LRESIEIGAPTRWRATAVAMLAGLVALVGLTAVPGADAKPKPKPKTVPVKVMTRNLFLGADLGPAIAAATPAAFVEANGAILREVTATDFPTRAKGLAAEIADKKPDLVGLQEVALWRDAPPSLTPVLSGPSATHVRYDFLQSLLDELSAAGLHYTPAVVQPEFDFEAPADENNVPNDNPNTPADPIIGNAEVNGRLTMRDVILVNDDSKVHAKFTNPQAGHYTNLLHVVVGGAVDVPVTRGWTSGDVKVSKGKGHKRVKAQFHFVNTHFESFDDETVHPSVRAQQASELLAGPAAPKNTILVGDLNSNVPPVKPGDEQAYQTLLDGGFSERSTSDPLGCCVSSVISGPATGFDHKVDHIMTNGSKKKVALANSAVTGLTQVNGFYDSDHAGLFSTLKLK
jgi:endonuclease/exonuclease/phosphatase family metal-dependent hydrolase